MKDHMVYFAHGKESGPWGRKILALSKVAKRKGFGVESPDYSSTKDPDRRVAMLLRLRPRAKKNLILVGSSMGGYVSAAASKSLKVQGLFLMAPAFYIPGYKFQSPRPAARLSLVIHGWADRVVPASNSIKYSQKYRSRLLLLESDHQLTHSLSFIERVFEQFLEEVLKGK